MLSTYDSVMGLETGDNNVGFTDFENPMMGSLYEIWMTTYVRERIGEIFRVSYDEFLNRPRWEMMKMLEVAKRRIAEMNKVQNAVVNDELEKQLQLKL